MIARLAGALACATLILPATAGAMTQRIVNGSPSTADELPYVAGLEIAIQNAGDDDPDALCGGSLIAARWILTAAHCLVEEQVDLEHSFAVLGATDLDTSTEEQHYGFADGFVPEGYASGGGGFDVGLIRLVRPAPQTQLRLLRARDGGLYPPDAEALTAGWGYTEDPQDHGTLSTDQLRKVDLRIYSDAECADAFSDAGQSGALEPDTEICALAPNKDSCNGDSGGPLLVNDGTGLPALVGAVSFGIGNGSILRGDRSCNEGPPGVYSEVASDPLNSFVREKVPQVEIDADVQTPVPGEQVTFTASPNDPGGNGPFGGYDALSWDLDGDGTFGEQAGKRKVTRSVHAGTTPISVRATSTAGDAEVRTIRVVTQNKSAVSFAKASARVRAGHRVKVRVRRVGRGGGSVKVRVSGHGVTPRARTIHFSGTEASRALRLRAGRKASRQVTVRLQSFAGDVVAGARTTLHLKVERAR
jgi:secreted trypsin-like serine protease